MSSCTCHLPSPASRRARERGAQPGESKRQFEVRWDRKKDSERLRKTKQDQGIKQDCSGLHALFAFCNLSTTGKASSLPHARSSLFKRFDNAQMFENSQRSLTWKRRQQYVVDLPQSDAQEQIPVNIVNIVNFYGIWKLVWELFDRAHPCQVCRMPRAFRSMCPGNESDQVMFAMFAMFMMFIFPPEIPGWNYCRCTGLKKNENVRRLSTKLGMYYKNTNVCHHNIREDVDTSTWGTMHERLWSKIVSNKPAVPTRHSMTLFKFEPMLEALQVSFWLLGSMARKKIRDKIELFKAPAMCRQTSRMKKIEIDLSWFLLLLHVASVACFERWVVPRISSLSWQQLGKANSKSLILRRGRRWIAFEVRDFLRCQRPFTTSELMLAMMPGKDMEMEWANGNFSTCFTVERTCRDVRQAASNTLLYILYTIYTMYYDNLW